MKILLLTPTVGRGGVTLITRKIFQGLADFAPSDWQFDILGQALNEYLEPVAYPAAFPFTQMDPADEPLPAHPKQFDYLYRNVQVFYDHLSRTAPGYDLVYSPSAWWIIRAKGWQLPVPFVCTVSDMAWNHFSLGKMLDQHFWLCSGLTATRSRMTVFSSEYWRQHALENYPFEADRTAVIHHSADFVAENFDPSPQEAERVRAKYGLPQGYVLAFHPLRHKMPETILNAQFLARRQSGAVPPLVFAGLETERLLSSEPDDSHIEEIRRLLKVLQFNPGRDFFCLGRIPEEDIAGLYAAATLSVSASRMEGDLSGNTLNSFMAHCPHIYSDITVYTMRLDCDRLGYTFRTGDPMHLSRCIIEACTNPDEARRRAIEAYAFAATRTVRDVANEYLDVFRQVVEKQEQG